MIGAACLCAVLIGAVMYAVRSTRCVDCGEKIASGDGDSIADACGIPLHRKCPHGPRAPKSRSESTSQSELHIQPRNGEATL